MKKLNRGTAAIFKNPKTIHRPVAMNRRSFLGSMAVVLGGCGGGEPEPANVQNPPRIKNVAINNVAIQPNNNGYYEIPVNLGAENRCTITLEQPVTDLANSPQLILLDATTGKSIPMPEGVIIKIASVDSKSVLSYEITLTTDPQKFTFPSSSEVPGQVRNRKILVEVAGLRSAGSGNATPKFEYTVNDVPPTITVPAYQVYDDDGGFGTRDLGRILVKDSLSRSFTFNNIEVTKESGDGTDIPNIHIGSDGAIAITDILDNNNHMKDTVTVYKVSFQYAAGKNTYPGSFTFGSNDNG